MADDLRKDAEDFLKKAGVCLHNEPSVVREDGYYDDLRDLLAEFASEVIEKSPING